MEVCLLCYGLGEGKNTRIHAEVSLNALFNYSFFLLSIICCLVSYLFHPVCALIGHTMTKKNLRNYFSALLDYI